MDTGKRQQFFPCTTVTVFFYYRERACLLRGNGYSCLVANARDRLLPRRNAYANAKLWLMHQMCWGLWWKATHRSWLNDLHLRLQLTEFLWPDNLPYCTPLVQTHRTPVTTLCNIQMLQTLLSLATSRITKFVPLLIFTNQFSPHPHPIRAQQPFNCNTTLAPLLYRQCMPTWISNTAIIIMELILEHAQNGTLIVVSVSQTFPIFRLPMLGPLWQLVPIASAHCLPV